MPHDTSIRGMTIEECRELAKVMGYTENALDHYCGHYIKIKILTIKYRGKRYTIGQFPVDNCQKLLSEDRCPLGGLKE